MAGVLDEIDKPNLTLEKLCEYLNEEEELPVNLRQLKYAKLRGEIVPTKLSNKNYYSRRQGLDWVAAQRGKYRKQSKLA